MNSPLAIGFCDGIAPQPGDFDAQDFDTDTKEKLSPSMPRQKLIPDLETLAARYSVGTRTIRRWSKSIDVRDNHAVADLLLRQRGPSPAALAACHSLLTETP
jgi:hypothetical protein